MAGAGTETAAVSRSFSLLERTDALGVLRDQLRAVTQTEKGRLVLVSGEAGIGKTALVTALCDELPPRHVLRGACDPLLTPRPLGPFADISEQTGGRLGELVQAGPGASAVAAATATELRRRAPAVVVLEDLHWADEATLDVLRLLARRLDGLPALVIVAYRDDELGRVHPLRVVLGELPRTRVTRLALRPLSLQAVATIGGPDVDARSLHARTGGNPFFVTEALAGGGSSLPETVRDAVLARASRLDAPARSLLDAVAIVPAGAELWLLESLAAAELVHLERCLGSGMLRAHGGTVAFRHEIARFAIEEGVAPDRALALHRAALAALAAPPHGRADLARVAHHAEAAGDAAAVLAHAPAAAERAASLGAHREAAAQFARALRFAGGASSEVRAALLDRRSYECYLTGALAEAIQARRQALAEHQRRKDRRREGDARRWLSRLAWFVGDAATAETEGRGAVELLEGLTPGRELAMARSNMAQLRMLASDLNGARGWGLPAIELAQQLGDAEILSHALTNVGTAEMNAGLPDGRPRLERGLEIARDAGLEEHVARAHTNLACGGIEQRDYALAGRHLEEGIAYCEERDLDAWRIYLTGWRARALLEQGRWAEATASATAVLDRPGEPVPSRIMPLATLGRLRARRGDPDPWTPLDEAAELAERTGERQRLLPVALARAEARWLAGEPQLVGAETERALAMASGWELGELLVWRRRAGLDDRVPPLTPAAPFELELHGEYRAAAQQWSALGCPYEAAMAWLDSDDEPGLRAGLAELQRLGARRAAAHLARRLRARGARDLRRGPYAKTRDNPGGLSGRELEVLGLVAEGLRNAEIAQRLVVSSKTVEHHVSSILTKLGVGSRTQAIAEAGRRGIIER